MSIPLFPKGKWFQQNVSGVFRNKFIRSEKIFLSFFTKTAATKWSPYSFKRKPFASI